MKTTTKSEHLESRTEDEPASMVLEGLIVLGTAYVVGTSAGYWWGAGALTALTLSAHFLKGTATGRLAFMIGGFLALISALALGNGYDSWPIYAISSVVALALGFVARLRKQSGK